MIYASNSALRRKPWNLPYIAEPREVAGLRNVMRIHLTLWGLPELAEAAQLCVTELASNVIDHVGVGTPATLAVSMRGTHLRLEMHDPDTRPLPTLLSVTDEDEAGRGMALIDALTDRWGVLLRGDGKVVWCELATEPLPPSDRVANGKRVARAEECLSVYEVARQPSPSGQTRLSVAVAEETATDLIADVLHWLSAHGCDPDEVLDRAQTRFEAEAEAA